MPTTKTTRYTSYFQDDDADAPRTVSRTASSAARPGRPARAAALHALGATPAPGSHADLVIPTHHEHKIHHVEHPHETRIHHAAPENGPMTRAKQTRRKRTSAGASTDRIPPISGKKATKLALHDSIREANRELHDALAESDELLMSQSTMIQHSAVKMLIEHRNQCIQKKKYADQTFKHEHTAQFHANSAAFEAHQPIPYRDLRKERVVHVHAQHHKFEDLGGFAKNINDLVHHYKRTREALTCPRPETVPGKDDTYYIIPLIRYLAREKYRVVEALLEDINTKQGTRSAWQEKMLANSDKVERIKQRISNAKQNLIGLRPTRTHTKPRKARADWVLPDKGALPPQVEVHRGE